MNVKAIELNVFPLKAGALPHLFAATSQLDPKVPGQT